MELQLKLGLKKKTITSKIPGMDSTVIFDRYYNLSLKYLSYRPRSEKEISDYLHEKQRRKKELTDELISEIIKKLKSYKFIDDKNFAKLWVEQRIKYKNKPIRVIRFELKQKGINEELINEVLPKEEVRETDLESAKKLAEKRKDFYRSLDEKKRNEKVMSYLLRKGFNYDIVKKAVSE